MFHSYIELQTISRKKEGHAQSAFFHEWHFGNDTVSCRWSVPVPVRTPARAVTPADADAAFAALNKVYWDQGIKFFRKEEHGREEHSPKKADFWFEAQLWDTVMDQYDRTGSPEVKRQINEVYDGFVKVYPDWTTNMYNDDIMWWAIACAAGI